MPPSMPAAMCVGLLQQRREPLLQRGEHVDLRMRPGRLARLDLGHAAAPACRAGRRSWSRRTRRSSPGRRGARPGSRARRPSATVPGSSSRPSSWPLVAQPVQVHHLVGEDVRLVAEDVVEAPQLLVEEARRPGGREDEPRAELLDVAQRAVELPLALGQAHRLLGPRRQLVDHREPDRAGELHEVGVDRAQLAELRRAPTGRASFWFSTRCCPSDSHSDESPIGPSVGEVSDWIMICRPSSVDDLAARRLDERGEADVAQRVLELGGREVRQQHRRLLADVLAQVLGVEVVAVQVRDEQVVGLTDRVPVQLRVVREREPRAEVGGVHPRVGQHGAVRGLDEHAGVPQPVMRMRLTVSTGRCQNEGSPTHSTVGPHPTGARTWPSNPHSEQPDLSLPDDYKARPPGRAPRATGAGTASGAAPRGRPAGSSPSSCC